METPSRTPWVLLLLAVAAASEVPTVVPVAVVLHRSGEVCAPGFELERVANASVAFFNNRSSTLRLRLHVLDAGSTELGAYTAAAAAASASVGARAIVGPGTSSAGVAKAQLVAASTRTPMLNFAGSSTGLAAQDMLLRTGPSDGARVGALLAAVRRFRWERFALIHTADAYGVALASEVEQELRALRSGSGGGGGGVGGGGVGEDGVALSVPVLELKGSIPPFTTARTAAGWADATAQLQDVCKRIRAAGTRVVLLAARGADAAMVLGTARDLGIAGAKGWAWLSPGLTGEAAAAGQALVARAEGLSRPPLGALELAAVRQRVSEASVRRAMHGILAVAPYHNAAHLQRLGMLGAAEAYASVAHARRHPCRSAGASPLVGARSAAPLFEAIWLLGRALEHDPAARGDVLLALLLNGTRSQPLGADAEDARRLPDGSFALHFDGVTHDRTPVPMRLHNLLAFDSGGRLRADGSVLATHVGVLVPPSASTSAAGAGSGWSFLKSGAAAEWPGRTTSIPPDRAFAGMYKEAVAFGAGLVCILLVIALSSVLLRLELHFVPEAGVPIIVGGLAGALCTGDGGGLLGSDLANFASFDTAFFGLVLLPIILFESGYSMQPVFFVTQLGSITTFATLGSLVSALVISAGLHFGSDFVGSIHLSLEECIAFAALIGAVDPVSTLSIFGELRVDARLHALVFGESMLNDVVAVALFRAAVFFFDHDVTATAVAENLVVHALVPCAGALAVGLATSLACTLALRVAQPSITVETIVVLSFSYLAFVFCELAHWSGIIASLYSGVLINTLIQPNLTPEAQHSCAAVFKLLSALSETVIFLLIGFSVVTVRSDAVVAAPFVAWTILLCLLGRAANIFPLAALVNVFRPPAERIPWQHQVVQWHAGARGAIAFAIALTFPSQNRDSIVVCTGSVIIFTVFAFGGTTPLMIRRLGIKTGDNPSQEELDAAMHRSRLSRAVQCFDGRLGDLLWGRSAHVKNTAKLLRKAMMERHMALHLVRIHRSGKLHSIRRKTGPPQVVGARFRSASNAALTHERLAKAAADATAAGLGMRSAGSSPNHVHIPKRSVALVGSNEPSSPRVITGAHRSAALKESGAHSQSPHREQPAPTGGLPTTSVQMSQQLPKVLV